MRDTGNELYDPVLDATKVIPAAIGNTLVTMEGALEETEHYPEAVRMAHMIQVCVEAAMPEDCHNIDRTLAEFLKHWKNISGPIRDAFLETFFLNLMVFLGVAVRRAEGGEAPVVPSVKDTLELGSLLALLSDDTADKVRKELRRHMAQSVAALKENSKQGPVTLMCGDAVVEDAKEWAAKMFPVSNGNQTWQQISDIINKAADRSTTEGKMLSQVFPSYEETE